MVRKSLGLIPLVALTMSVCAQQPAAPPAGAPFPNVPNVPTNMKQYTLGLYVHGPKWTAGESAETQKLLVDHVAYLRSQIELHKLVMAGPILDHTNLTGMLVIPTTSAGEAKAVTDGDPEVKAGRLAVELHPVMLPSLDGVRVSF